MKFNNIAVGIVLALSLLVTLCSAQADLSRDEQVWRPDSNILSRLATRVVVSGFSLSPPKGYALNRVHQNPNTEAYAWRGHARQDGLTPNFLLDVSSNVESVTLEDIIDAYISRLKTSGMPIARGRPERGFIDGIHFIRVYWMATTTINGRKYDVQGFVYAGRHAKTVVLMASQDVDPYQTEALKIAESSAMSLELTHP